jgi:hypothetical protein
VALLGGDTLSRGLATKEFAYALAEHAREQNYRMLVVVAFHDDGDVNATVVGGSTPDDLDDIAEAFAQLIEDLGSSIAFQEPKGSA